jgi:4-hydroxy-tetrahydrodipicolinate synthase
MTFRGTYTALVTPFNASDGAVDYGKLRALLEEQIAGGVEGVVPVGTSGESPTLSYEEHDKVVAVTCEVCHGRVQVIAGTGANSTREAVELTRHAIDAGADATLQVTPYYNKPSQEGLYRHFSTVAELGLPVVLYNVPGRAGREIAVETVARLAHVPGIAAVKEAGGSVDRVSKIKSLCDIPVLSGDDSLTVPMISVGACGVVSVASNVLPRETSDMVRAALAGDFATAGALHRRLYPLFRDLFLETNPVPVKAALAYMGKIDEVYRLPLCEMDPKNAEALRATLRALGL